MNNEQRAHDFAIMLTSFYLNNPDKAENQIPELNPSSNIDEHLFIDPLKIYNAIYEKSLNYLNHEKS